MCARVLNSLSARAKLKVQIPEVRCYFDVYIGNDIGNDNGIDAGEWNFNGV